MAVVCRDYLPAGVTVEQLGAMICIIVFIALLLARDFDLADFTTSLDRIRLAPTVRSPGG